MRWAGLVVIALGEVTWLAIRIEAPSTGLLTYTKGFPSIFITSLAVALILGWARSYGRVRELSVFHEAGLASWLMVLAHLGGFATFFWLTIWVFEGEGASSTAPLFWFLTWAAAGLATGVFWLLAAMPARAWIRLIRTNVSVVSAGFIIVTASVVWGFFAGRAWRPLRGPTFLLVRWLLTAFGQDVVSQPAHYELGTKQFSVGIYPACAGYEGIGLMVLFAGVYLWLFWRRLRFPQAYLLLPGAVPRHLAHQRAKDGPAGPGRYLRFPSDCDGRLSLPAWLAWLYRNRLRYGGTDPAPAPFRCEPIRFRG